MKKAKIVIICSALSAIILSSCTKNDGIINTPVNYDALYVVNKADNSLSVINLTSEKVEKTMNLGTLTTAMMGGGMMSENLTGNNMWPYHISLSPDNSNLAITEPGMDFNGGYEMMQTTTSSGGMSGMMYQHNNSNSSTVISDILQMHGQILILDAVP